MEQIIVDIIVAGAVLFLVRWLYRSFVSKRHEDAPACGSCSQCAAEPRGVDAPSPGAIEFKG